ncbi:RDD family protein [Staphylococcus agnetis]|uniref:RDD family protein n=1 Tax=Staphylococcus agnetis TaxID=985762 RepID=UPI000DF8B0BA|nr:RDD family protein [Staphylococcus agnetis]SUK13209.1 RDD family protein [Staphylococcus agnetis]
MTINEYHHNASNNVYHAHPHASTFLTKHQHELNAFFYAGFGRRFLSYIIDLLILWSVFNIVLNPILVFTGADEFKLWISYFSLTHILNALLYFLYFVLMTKYFQQTLGKMILGIKVYRKDLKKPLWSDVIFREWIGRIISNILLGLPYLAVLFTPKHIGVHDYFADTVVIKNKYLKYIQENEGL